jgi:L-ascorbate metabolism protein UlaG (beta-lactamase superfamily)
MLNRLLLSQLIVLASVYACTTTNSTNANYQISDHFDGKVFFNPGQREDHTFGQMVKWLWEMDTVDWPDWVVDKVQPPPPERVGTGKIRITFINHATVLIQMDNVNILTDPIWSYRAGPLSWLGSKRVRDPGVTFEELPPIDIILISHNHYDHLDLRTLTKITARDAPEIITGLGNKKILGDSGIQKVSELDWWQSITVSKTGLTYTFVPAKHNSGRTPFQRNKTLWGGFVISNTNGDIYFAGDTAFGPFFKKIAQSFRRIHIAMLPIGNYEKRWFMKNQHMNPDDAVRAHRILGAGQSMGIHYGTFVEHPEQTIDAHEKDLATALEKHHVDKSKFWVFDFGEGRNIRLK